MSQVIKYKLDHNQLGFQEWFPTIDRNMLLLAPTGAGKTLMASMVMEQIIKSGKACLVTFPYLALSEEKREDWSKIWKLSIDTGDYKDKSAIDYENFEVMITTNERLLSILRNKKLRHTLLKRTGLIVFDEIHMVDDPNRGFTVEKCIMILNHLKEKYEDPFKIMGLSATLPNHVEFAEFMDAEYYFIPESERPVPLRSVYQIITGKDKNEIHTGKQDYIERLENRILIFLNSRGRTRGWAHNDAIRQTGNWFRISGPDDLFDYDTAWHNAGLSKDQRKKVEQAFLNDRILRLYATTTLAAGINLPADQTVIAEISRWDGRRSIWRFLRSNELKQMAGRAGRRGLSDYGVAHFLGLSHEIEYAQDKMENPDPIKSHFMNFLEAAVLDFIYLGMAETYYQLLEVTKLSFGGGNVPEALMKQKLYDAIQFILKNGFIKIEKPTPDTYRYVTKPLGNYTTRRYLNPRSVAVIRRNIKLMKEEMPDNSMYGVGEFLAGILGVEEVIDGWDISDMDEELMKKVDLIMVPDNFDYQVMDEGEIFTFNGRNPLRKLIGAIFSRKWKEENEKFFHLIPEATSWEAKNIAKEYLEIAEVLTNFVWESDNVKKRIIKVKKAIEEDHPNMLSNPYYGSPLSEEKQEEIFKHGLFPEYLLTINASIMQKFLGSEGHLAHNFQKWLRSKYA